jgi:hypothetical protein
MFVDGKWRVVLLPEEEGRYNMDLLDKMIEIAESCLRDVLLR